jgi:hypothetical protein
LCWKLASKEHTMSRQEGTRRARCVRWLGFDRNPLRRRTDRIEAVIRLITLILLLVVVPIVTLAVGRQADHVALRHARALQATDHEVTAVLLQQAPPTGIPDPYTSIQMTLVLARWQPPGQPARSGPVPAPAGARAGSTLTVWVDAAGAVTSPPTDPRVIAGDVCIAGVVTCMAASLLVLGANALGRRALDRRRMRAWDAEWRATGPLWSGNRG